ncbi:MAG TPA: 4-vinyl reductase [Chloroflexi bacterium]|jgi:predicted hydrocarbon binding protein|nr:4-vinyl reductase [Chloroflexota bacterium]
MANKLIPPSGLYYPNKIARLAYQSLEIVMGKNGLNSILNLAGLTEFINNYPSNNLAREYDFADFSALFGALEQTYGIRGARGLALRAGRTVFDEGYKSFGALAGAGDLAFKILPLSTKLKIGIPAMAKVFTSTSDQYSTVRDAGDHFIYTMHKCPVCWGRTSKDPCCHMGAGLLQEGLKWVSGGREFRVVQTTCHACGDENCQYDIFKEPLPE